MMKLKCHIAETKELVHVVICETCRRESVYVLPGSTIYSVLAKVGVSYTFGWDYITIGGEWIECSDLYKTLLDYGFHGGDQVFIIVNKKCVNA